VAGLAPAGVSSAPIAGRSLAEPQLAGEQLTDDSVRRGVTRVRFDGGRLVVDERVDAPAGD
jgi:hypothetical protein